MEMPESSESNMLHISAVKTLNSDKNLTRPDL